MSVIDGFQKGDPNIQSNYSTHIRDRGRGLSAQGYRAQSPLWGVLVTPSPPNLFLSSRLTQPDGQNLARAFSVLIVELFCIKKVEIKK